MEDRALAVTRRRAGAGAAAALAAIPVVLAACGGETSTAPAATRTMSGPKVVSYTTWGDVSRPAVQEMLQVFPERFGGAQVEASSIPSGEYVAKVTALAVAGSAPDVAQVENQNFPAFAKVNLYKPLEPFFNRDRSMSPKDFFADQLTCYTSKGQLYCLPGGLVPNSAIFANKTLFEAAGLQVPTPEQSQNSTWDTVIDLARKLTKPDGSQFGLAVAPFHAVPYSGSAYWVNDRANPTRGALDDPRWARSVDLWVDWTQKQHVAATADDRTKLGERNWQEAFAHGKIAMYLDGSWQVGPFLAAEPQLRWDVFWVPRLAANQPRKFATGGAGWGVTQNARNPDLSWEWVKFVDRKPGSYEIELKHTQPMTVLMSTYIPVNNKEIDRLKKLGMANVDIFTKGANDVLWWPFHQEWPRINSAIIGPELGKLQRGEVPAAGALKSLNEQVTRELQLG